MLMQLLPQKGTYLDVGCATPVKYSNTFLLYLHNWKGTCVDIRKIRRFKWLRRRDKFVQANIQSLAEYSDYDLLDLDVDGIEEHLLRTMTFHPRWIVCENNLETQKGVDNYLLSIWYKKLVQTIHNEIFQKRI